MPLDSGPQQTLPAPRPVRHAPPLLWWLLIVVTCMGVARWPEHTDGLAARSAVPPAGQGEHQAFVAVLLGKVDAQDGRALPPEVLRRQLVELQAAGAHAVTLPQVQSFMERGTPLPARPVLLAFEDARRTTIEAVDPILAELGMSAVAFVDVEAVERGGIELIARRYLRSLAASGRWEFALKDCAPGAAQGRSAASAERAAAILAQWSGTLVRARSCLGAAGAALEAPAAVVPLHFVQQAAGANYRDDPARTLRLIRHSAAAREPAALAGHLGRYLPRRQILADDFDGAALGPDWLARAAQVQLDAGTLRLFAPAGAPAAVLAPGGAQRWRDARVDVELQTPPSGEFWIYARRSGADSFLRLGVVDAAVVLQVTDASGRVHELARQPAPRGPLRLDLTVLGNRAIARLDGQPLLERPAALPAHLASGDFGLAVWGAATPAAAAIRRAAFEPLQRRVVLVAADPDAADLSALVAQSAGLWAVSPRLYRWRRGAGQLIEALPRRVSMRLHEQRFMVLPAVLVDEWPRGADWDAFAQDVLRWATAHDVAGLNLVLRGPGAPDSRALDALRRRVEAAGKHLAITAMGKDLVLGWPEGTAWLEENAGSTLLQPAGAVPRQDHG